MKSPEICPKRIALYDCYAPVLIYDIPAEKSIELFNFLLKIFIHSETW